ncbi:MAG: PKD domain-containing protein [Nitrospira sp.]
MTRERYCMKRLDWSFMSGLLALTIGLAYTHTALAFKIVEPRDGATVTAGKSMTANVDLGQDTGGVQVSYYWYGELDETLVEQKGNTSAGAIVKVAALVADSHQNPPFGGALTVPKDAIGPMRLLAVAEISRGRLGTRTVFDEILVSVAPGSELTAIDFETDKPLKLGRAGQAAAYGQIDSLGKTFELPVIGSFTDGIERKISAPASGTTYQSSDETVIRILADGLLQIVGNGKTVVTVTNRGKQATLDVFVEVNTEPNELPVANAGPNKTVKAGAKVKLSGLKSHDLEGEALFYQWSQVRGSKVSLLDANGPEATFQAPQVSEKRLYRFRLRVTDGKGADSMPAYVDVTVEP